MRQTIHIPEYYVFVAANSVNKRETYRKMITAYLAHNYPGYKLIDYYQRTALIERDEPYEKNHS
ncbi:hypothetical protein HXA31_20240 [Salipaludibacillus agaradhaerens]|jgi:hypothetical protein|uniref:hypothetical protein n=1 Tax=Salipaludibacillus TaxID=1884449 RepID=UPI0020D00B77|nr:MULTISPECIES: hypothetical protein [Salipaludibacillus]MCR6116661.1 hypothetical protein [Salipaludibacillus agaradhaerens]UTR13462.1 hypothetical protein MM221_12575 [Salipaludibacillus sp. LMS25]